MKSLSKVESCSAKICRSILLQKKFHISKQFYLLVICLYFFCFKTKEKCWKVLKNVKTLWKKKLLFKKFFMRNNYKITGIGGIRNFQVSLHEQNQYLLAVFQFAWLCLSDKLSVVFLNSFENVSEIISETWTMQCNYNSAFSQNYQWSVSYFCKLFQLHDKKMRENLSRLYSIWRKSTSIKYATMFLHLVFLLLERRYCTGASL